MTDHETPRERPKEGGAESVLRPRKHDVDEIVTHLAVAERQSLPTDDQIIMGHLRAALVLALSLQRQLRT